MIETFPVLDIEDYQTAWDSTPKFEEYATYTDKIVKLPLSALMTVSEWSKGKNQYARARQNDFSTIKSLAASYLGRGVVANRPLIVVTPHPTKDDQFIVVEGNNRTSALAEVAETMGLDPKDCPVVCLMAHPREGESIEIMLAGLGTAMNWENLPQVANKMNDPLTAGKRLFDEGYFDDDTTEDEVKDWLYSQGVDSFLQDGTITHLAGMILDRDVLDPSLTQLTDDSIKELVKRSDGFFLSNGRINKTDGFKCFTSPLAQTDRTAINNWSSYADLLVKGDHNGVRFLLWNSDLNINTVHTSYGRYFKVFYERYTTAYKLIHEMHGIVNGPESMQTPEEFFSNEEFEFWRVAQIAGKHNNVINGRNKDRMKEVHIGRHRFVIEKLTVRSILQSLNTNKD